MENVIFMKEVDDKFSKVLKEELGKIFKENDKIAVKIHMGETGNKYYLKPDYAKIIISVLKDLGTNPFIFDSLVIYPGGRDTVEKYLKTAADHGFTEEKIGCPIIISNESQKVKTQNLEVEVCKPIKDADGLLVLTHVKGHMCCGFGGSIKNLGMGGVTVKTKKDIHSLSVPEFCGECIGCGVCVKTCPVAAISLKDSKAEINYAGCWGCGQCIVACPSKVLKPKLASFDTLIAEGASAVLKDKKAYFINSINNITKLCDCCSDPQGIVLDDIGFLLGKDIVSVEKASVDLINKKAGKDIFEEIHKKSPLIHIKEAEKLGLGSLEYSLVEK